MSSANWSTCVLLVVHARLAHLEELLQVLVEFLICHAVHLHRTALH